MTLMNDIKYRLGDYNLINIQNPLEKEHAHSPYVSTGEVPVLGGSESLSEVDMCFYGHKQRKSTVIYPKKLYSFPN